MWLSRLGYVSCTTVRRWRREEQTLVENRRHIGDDWYCMEVV